MIKNAIAEAMNPEKPEEVGSASSDSDDEALGKKKDKNLGGLPRKSFKKIIKKELDKQCQQIFNNMMNMRELGQNEEQNEDLAIIHQNITCDGCGQIPIVGIRYKCSVCKNLDYCTMCEERKGHEHAMLKIYKPNQCPKVMFTVIDENMPNAKADIEQNDDTFFRNQGQRGGHCKRGGRWGGRGGRCGQANAHGQP